MAKTVAWVGAGEEAVVIWRKVSRRLSYRFVLLGKTDFRAGGGQVSAGDGVFIRGSVNLAAEKEAQHRRREQGGDSGHRQHNSVVTLRDHVHLQSDESDDKTDFATGGHADPNAPHGGSTFLPDRSAAADDFGENGDDRNDDSSD